MSVLYLIYTLFIIFLLTLWTLLNISPLKDKLTDMQFAFFVFACKGRLRQSPATLDG